MRMTALAALLLASASIPAVAQEMDHSHMDHGAMERIEAEHEGEDHSGHQMPMQAAPVADNPHAGHAMPAADDAIPKGEAPPVPTDHAADAYFDPGEMARARAAMLKESGGMTFSQIMLDRLEYRMG